ncbi:MAG: methionine--tRNA ligase subunit beta, partial [Clostridia bacterium]|nr:methionine--tRNA ligase subunit beta [Clostridia bacterium]
IGKDILRFHTIYWPVILMALGLPMPKKIFGHPWLLVGMDKISKSRGNAIYADDLAGFFGTDAVRYYVLAEMPYLNDGSITYESFIARYNADLANTLGNLVNRTVAMINKYFGGIIPSPSEKDDHDDDLIAVIENGVKAVKNNFESFHIADAADDIMTVLRRLNKYIDETTPWVLGKDESKKARLETVMYNLYEGIRICATMLYPFMPESAEKIICQINDPDNIVCNIKEWEIIEKFGTAVPAGAKVNPKPEPLFARIDEEKKMAEINAANEAKKAAQPKKTDADKKEAEECELIGIEDFAKVKLVCAKVLSAEPVEKSDKLLKIKLFDGDGERQVVSGIAKAYSPEELVGKKVILVANLKPAKLRGVESHGMLLAAGIKNPDGSEDICVNFLDDRIPEGSIIR